MPKNGSLPGAAGDTMREGKAGGEMMPEYTTPMPEPLTAASAFATLIGLIRSYRQEKGARAQLDNQKFIEWLQYHRHEDIKNLIVNTAVLRTEVDQLLRADHEIIMAKLDAISTILASLTSQVTEFRGLAITLVPQAELSAQAISILRHLVNSNSNFLVYLDMGQNYGLQSDEDEPLQITEPRFLRDDVEKLIELGLVSAERTSNITTLLHITRDAARYISAMDGTTPPGWPPPELKMPI